MVRILHFADAHVGFTTHSDAKVGTDMPSRISDCLDRLEEIAEIAEREEPDLIIFAGDLFHSPNPDNPLRTAVAAIIHSLANVPMVMIAGNHDTIRRKRGHPFETFDYFHTRNIITAQDYKTFAVSTAAGPVFIGTAPYPNPWSYYLGANAGDEDTRGRAISTLKAMSQQAKYVEDMPRILIGHFSIEGAYYNPNQQVGQDDELSIPPSAFEEGWDYVAMGHLHRRQNVGETTPVVYPGSIERVTFNEKHNEPSVIIADVERDRTAMRYVPLTARLMFEVEIELSDGSRLADMAIKLLRDEPYLAESIVRVNVSLPLSQAQAARDSYADLQAFADARLVSHLNTINRYYDDSPLRDTVSRIEAMTPTEMLELYLKRHGLDDDLREMVIALAEPILDRNAS